ncbi:type II secretion system protein N [uncultured Piscinibacter sp.]|uniref:type II secretion system protein N n=1 Tax=uncultured Piscinibacter sp. TaxID=1131835 RepID=UPI002639D60B|nr:type II secretion system protein N [uncultured Piscinibacter sp.]
MLARLTAFVVWALVAATAVFWGLRMLVRPQAAPAYTVPVGDVGALRGDLSRLLGATATAPSATQAAPAPELASRFKLIGIMASKQPDGAGYALIAVDAKPARAYAVGAPLDGDIVLQSVSLRTAAIGPAQGSPAVTLEIPALPAPATGTLPGPADGVKFGAAAPVVQPVPQPLHLPAQGAAVPGRPVSAPPSVQPPAPVVPRTRNPGLTNR